VHDFDLIRFSLGLNPKTITGWSWQPPWGDFNGETSVQILIEFEQGVRVNYLGAWASWVGEYFWRVDGSRGILRASNDLQFGDPETGAYTQVPVPELSNSEWPLMDELMQAIRGGKPARTSGRDNLWTIAMMEATQIATGQDNPVDVGRLING
jgi:predicted dehydrogenase